MALPLIERKRRLERLLAKAPPSIRYGEHLVTESKEFFEAAAKLGVEGVVSKRLDAPYAPTSRGAWRKSKCHRRDEFVIVGFSEPEGSRSYLGALLLGYYGDDGRLLYAGRAGTGMSERELKRLYATLKPLEVPNMPLAAAPPKENRFGSPLNLSRVHWVKPQLVCEVRYMTWTDDGLLRHVSYEGLREDKPAREVRRPIR
jgi:bifunctional non-homologous end joining protein LigD